MLTNQTILLSLGTLKATESLKKETQRGRKVRGLLSSICLTVTFCLSIYHSFGQRNKKAVPQYSFIQSDSIANKILTSVLTDSSFFVVVYTEQSVGGYRCAYGKYAAHKNHFDTYVLYSSGHRFYVQKVDNYGYFRKRHVKAQAAYEFLKQHFSTMIGETLSPKIDTIHDGNGTMTTTTTIVDHQIVRIIRIVKAHDTLQYEYPNDYAANKLNNETYKVKFLTTIDNVIRLYDKKQKRLSVLLGFDR